MGVRGSSQQHFILIVFSRVKKWKRPKIGRHKTGKLWPEDVILIRASDFSFPTSFNVWTEISRTWWSTCGQIIFKIVFPTGKCTPFNKEQEIIVMFCGWSFYFFFHFFDIIISPFLSFSPISSYVSLLHLLQIHCLFLKIIVIACIYMCISISMYISLTITYSFCIMLLVFMFSWLWTKLTRMKQDESMLA